MTQLIAAPQLISAAATDLTRIGSIVNDANAFAATRTTALAAAGTDEVSAAVAALFGSHARDYQAIGARVAGLQEQFVA
ncbi:PE family protein, partial [Mycobacterium kansasii]